MTTHRTGSDTRARVANVEPRRTLALLGMPVTEALDDPGRPLAAIFSGQQLALKKLLDEEVDEQRLSRIPDVPLSRAS